MYLSILLVLSYLTIIDCQIYNDYSTASTTISRLNYASNENYIYYLTAPLSYYGGYWSLSFTSFVTESNYDYLYIYDGQTTSSSVLGQKSGNLAAFTIKGTNNRFITMQFRSDGSINYAGWSVNCVYITSYAVRNTLTISSTLLTSTTFNLNSTVLGYYINPPTSNKYYVLRVINTSFGSNTDKLSFYSQSSSTGSFSYVLNPTSSISSRIYDYIYTDFYISYDKYGSNNPNIKFELMQFSTGCTYIDKPTTFNVRPLTTRCWQFRYFSGYYWSIYINGTLLNNDYLSSSYGSCYSSDCTLSTYNYYSSIYLYYNFGTSTQAATYSSNQDLTITAISYVSPTSSSSSTSSSTSTSNIIIGVVLGIVLPLLLVGIYALYKYGYCYKSSSAQNKDEKAKPEVQASIQLPPPQIALVVPIIHNSITTSDHYYATEMTPQLEILNYNNHSNDSNNSNRLLPPAYSE